MYAVVSWVGRYGKDLHIVKEHYPYKGGNPKLFHTKEEAEEHCNTELFGWDWDIINLEVE